MRAHKVLDAVGRPVEIVIIKRQPRPWLRAQHVTPHLHSSGFLKVIFPRLGAVFLPASFIQSDRITAGQNRALGSASVRLDFARVNIVVGH